MVTREILNSHPITNLKKEISKTNIRGYSKMTKAQLVDVMMKNKERFGHIKAHTKAKPAKVAGFKSGDKVKIKRKPKAPPLTERKGLAKQPKAVKVTQLTPKQKEKVKNIPASELKKFTGLSKEEANKLNPLQLFGKLPAELRKTILQPKTTGVKVGGLPPKRTVTQFNKIFGELRTEYLNETDSTRLPAEGVPESYSKDIKDLYLEVRSFLTNYRGTLISALGLKNSKKPLFELARLVKKKKLWHKKIKGVLDSPSQTWYENTRPFEKRINELKKIAENAPGQQSP